jgi:hypothetical protein
MNLYPIAEYLQDAGLGTLAESIFINMIPVESPSGILLRNRLQGTVIDHELPGFYKTRFQVIVRATSYPAGEELIGQVLAALSISETQVGSMHIRYMRPVTLPVVFPLSKGNLLEFAADFDVAFDE